MKPNVLPLLDALLEEHIRRHPRAQLDAQDCAKIEQMRAVDPPVPWRKISAALSAGGIKISPQALSHAFSPREGDHE